MEQKTKTGFISPFTLKTMGTDPPHYDRERASGINALTVYVALLAGVVGYMWYHLWKLVFNWVSAVVLSTCFAVLIVLLYKSLFTSDPDDKKGQNIVLRIVAIFAIAAFLSMPTSLEVFHDKIDAGFDEDARVVSQGIYDRALGKIEGAHAAAIEDAGASYPSINLGNQEHPNLVRVTIARASEYNRLRSAYDARLALLDESIKNITTKLEVEQTARHGSQYNTEGRKTVCGKVCRDYKTQLKQAEDDKDTLVSAPPAELTAFVANISAYTKEAEEGLATELAKLGQNKATEVKRIHALAFGTGSIAADPSQLCQVYALDDCQPFKVPTDPFSRFEKLYALATKDVSIFVTGGILLCLFAVFELFGILIWYSMPEHVRNYWSRTKRKEEEDAARARKESWEAAQVVKVQTEAFAKADANLRKALDDFNGFVTSQAAPEADGECANLPQIHSNCARHIFGEDGSGDACLAMAFRDFRVSERQMSASGLVLPDDCQDQVKRAEQFERNWVSMLPSKGTLTSIGWRDPYQTAAQRAQMDGAEARAAEVRESALIVPALFDMVRTQKNGEPSAPNNSNGAAATVPFASIVAPTPEWVSRVHQRRNN